MEQRLAKRAGRGPVLCYGVAIASPLLGLLPRLVFAPLLAHKDPYITFFLATAVSATFGGLGPGLLTTFLGGILAACFVVRPYGALPFADMSDYLGLFLFFCIGSLISYLAGRLFNATQHENALRTLFEQTLNSIGDAVLSIDEEKRVRLVNPVAERLTGWTQEDAKGKHVDEVFRIVKEGSDMPAENPIDRVLKTGAAVGLANHTELLAKDGRRVPIDDSGAPIKDDQGVVAGAVLVFRDITDRRRAERTLEKAERRSREVLESITEAFVCLDSEWRITYINPAGEKFVGRSAESLIGKNHWEEFPDAVGTEVERSYRRAAAENVQVHFEVLYDAWDKWFEIYVYPGTGELAVYFRDITERKHSEIALRRLNEDLKQFTFAATHDLREPLRMMTIFSQMLALRLDEKLDDEGRLYISHVINGGRRISRLVDGLLEFTRLGELGQVRPVSVNAELALSEALDNLKVLVAETEAVVLGDRLPKVLANQAHLGQVLQNLVENALKYRKPNVRPEIRISAQPQDSWCVFAVKDNGIGVNSQYFSEIFAPFKRLHGMDVSGAGIGLATCKRIVERYNGRIWVESEEGEGSTFYFTLARDREDDAPARIATKS